MAAVSRVVRRRGSGWAAAVSVLVLLCCAACSGPSSGGEASSSSSQPVSASGASRTAPQVYVPPTYRKGTPAPLVILLHGYSGTSADVGEYIDLQPVAAARGFLYVRPNGTKDSTGNQFWNATDACCDLNGVGVDDSGYLATLIGDLRSTYSVDPRRIYVIGHSNGGFMAHRMACDHADLVAGIVSLAGATFEDTSKCRPTTAVSVLQVHGTADNTIPYDGGSVGGAEFPAAPVTAKDWATLDHCTATPTPGRDLDIAGQPDTRTPGGDLSGAETQVLEYGGCENKASVELWSIKGGGHIPGLTPAFATDIMDFLLAHPKP